MATTWRRALTSVVTVKRSETTTSPSGATSFHYDTVVAEHVSCSLQDAGGRVRQADVGQVPGRRKSVLFGEEMVGVVRQNDLIELEDYSGDLVPGDAYRLTHIHFVASPHAPHVEATAEQYALSGSD